MSMKTSVLLGALLICIASCKKIRPTITGHEGQIMPTFNILLQDSVTLINTGRLRGPSYVVFYFNPNCPFCKAQTRDIIKNIGKFHNTEFFFITSWSFNEMKAYSYQFNLKQYPQIKVGTDDSVAFVNYFRLTAAPFIAIYDKDKKLKNAFLGRVPVQQLLDIAQSEHN
jgi:thiol-disulfide isomerase/thioredoxin